MKQGGAASLYPGASARRYVPFCCCLTPLFALKLSTRRASKFPSFFSLDVLPYPALVAISLFRASFGRFSSSIGTRRAVSSSPKRRYARRPFLAKRLPPPHRPFSLPTPARDTRAPTSDSVSLINLIATLWRFSRRSQHARPSHRRFSPPPPGRRSTTPREAVEVGLRAP